MTCTRPHALITGAGSGIGQATVTAALDAGFHVFAGDRAKDGASGQLIDGPRTRLRLDVTDAADIDRAAEVIGEHVGDRGLDALANVAGIGMAVPLEVVDSESLRRIFEVNVIGQMALTRAMTPLVRIAEGRIVFVGSIGDRLTVPFAGPLTASKAAIASLSDTLRQELAPWGIQVILVEPASIHTPAVDAMNAEVQRTSEGFSAAHAQLYGESYRGVLAKFLEQEEHGSPPEVAAETIVKALTDSRPKPRYLTGDGATKLALLAKLPLQAQDAAKRRIFGLPRPRSVEDGEGSSR